MTAPENSMLNYGFLQILKQIKYAGKQLNSNHLSMPPSPEDIQVSTVQTISTFLVEEILKRGLYRNGSKTATIPWCLPLRLRGAELS